MRFYQLSAVFHIDNYGISAHSVPLKNGENVKIQPEIGRIM